MCQGIFGHPVDPDIFNLVSDALRMLDMSRWWIPSRQLGPKTAAYMRFGPTAVSKIYTIGSIRDSFSAADSEILYFCFFKATFCQSVVNPGRPCTASQAFSC